MTIRWFVVSILAAPQVCSAWRLAATQAPTGDRARLGLGCIAVACVSPRELWPPQQLRLARCRAATQLHNDDRSRQRLVCEPLHASHHGRSGRPRSFAQLRRPATPPATVLALGWVASLVHAFRHGQTGRPRSFVQLGAMLPGACVSI